MYKYEVGTLYNSDKTSWQESVQFNIRDGQPELLLFFASPSFHETLAVRKSECEFGVLKIGDVIFLLYRFGSEIKWSDQPYSIHLTDRTERQLPVLETDEQRLVLQIMLIDALTGILKVIRAVTLAPEFSAELLKLTNEQLAAPFSENDYKRQLANIYARYPQTKDLLAECFVFTKGGI